MTINSIRILGLPIRIVADGLLSIDRGLAGELRPGLGEIAIEPNRTAPAQGEVLLHETFESLADRLVMRDKPFDHAALSRLSECLYAVLVDNAPLFRRVLAKQRIVSSGGNSKKGKR